MIGILLCAAIFLPGCGGGSVDETKPLTELQAEAEDKEAAELVKMAEAYRDAVADKVDDIEDLESDIRKIPVDEMLGEDARAIKAEMTAISASLDALVERFNLYVELAAKKGADTSGLKLK